MRAVAVKEFKAEPELVEVPLPEPGAGEVLVRIEAAGLNPFDWQTADGLLKGRAPHVFPLVIGVDFAGRVEALGSGVTRFALGDAVYGQAARPPVGTGTYAEYVTMPEDGSIGHTPSAISLKTAAAVPTAGMTAADILNRAAVRERESLLIIGAAGGVGTFLTQLAASRDVRVLAVTRGAEQVRMGLFGAAVTIDSSTESLEDRVRDEYPDGVDVLVDLVSADAASFEANARLVHDGGVALTTRFVADPAALAEFGVEGVNFGLTASAELLATLAREVDTGTLKVSVEAEVPLEQAPQALTRSRSGGARGKTIIVP